MTAGVRRLVRVVSVGVIGVVVGGFAASGASSRAAVERASTSAQPPQRATTLFVCAHKAGSSRECPDTTRNVFTVDGADIMGGALILRLRDGRTIRFMLEERMDAVFFTPESIEILAEHYVAQRNTREAANLRTELGAAQRISALGRP